MRGFVVGGGDEEGGRLGGIFMVMPELELDGGGGVVFEGIGGRGYEAVVVEIGGLGFLV